MEPCTLPTMYFLSTLLIFSLCVKTQVEMLSCEQDVWGPSWPDFNSGSGPDFALSIGD